MIARRTSVLLPLLVAIAAPVALTACPESRVPPTPDGNTTTTTTATATATATDTATASATSTAPAPSDTASAQPSASASSSSSGGEASKCAGAPPQPGWVCAQTCGPPVVRPESPPPPYAWMDPKGVKDGHAAPCPICLPADARIATPSGDVSVHDVRVGTMVWTMDENGHRVAAPVVQVGSTPVPSSHEIVRAVLSDGRVVRGSPGHPTAEGKDLGALRPGDLLDGARVVKIDLVPYAGGRTFDLLPAGPTGVYWSDGVELGTTLRSSATHAN